MILESPLLTNPIFVHGAAASADDSVEEYELQSLIKHLWKALKILASTISTARFWPI